MSFAVLTEPVAEREWSDAVAWYEEQETGVGLRFNEEVRTLLRTIAEQPERFPLATVRTRKAKIIDWPYSIYFTVNKEHREVKIVAVWHGSQNPAKLRPRLR